MMRPWVRYSVTVYLGLLLAGSIATPLPTISETGSAARTSRAPVTGTITPRSAPTATQQDNASSQRRTNIAWQSTAEANTYQP